MASSPPSSDAPGPPVLGISRLRVIGSTAFAVGVLAAAIYYGSGPGKKIPPGATRPEDVVIQPPNPALATDLLEDANRDWTNSLVPETHVPERSVAVTPPLPAPFPNPEPGPPPGQPVMDGNGLLVSVTPPGSVLPNSGTIPGTKDSSGTSSESPPPANRQTEVIADTASVSPTVPPANPPDFSTTSGTEGSPAGTTRISSASKPGDSSGKPAGRSGSESSPQPSSSPVVSGKDGIVAGSKPPVRPGPVPSPVPVLGSAGTPSSVPADRNVAATGSRGTPSAAREPVEKTSPAGERSPSSSKRSSASSPAVARTPATTGGNSPSPELPQFKRPLAPRNGVVLQSASLVTTRQMPRADFPAAAPPPPATGGTPPVTGKTPPASVEPVTVTKTQAVAYAAQLTQTLRHTGAITPTQVIRLPTSGETTSRVIWCGDDTPVSPAETRPFGLVIEESNSAALSRLPAAAPAATPPTHTENGIPLRTDIPPGTSPLEKHGPVKPAWTRPEGE